jgi:hypothetical protein
MKSKEEIEKLAEKWCTNVSSSEKLAYKDGYNQCQEDMVDKIEIKWNEYRTVTNNEDAWLFKQWLISSLNKQD